MLLIFRQKKKNENNQHKMFVCVCNSDVMQIDDKYTVTGKIFLNVRKCLVNIWIQTTGHL